MSETFFSEKEVLTLELSGTLWDVFLQSVGIFETLLLSAPCPRPQVGD